MSNFHTIHIKRVLLLKSRKSTKGFFVLFHPRNKHKASGTVSLPGAFYFSKTKDG